MILGSVGDNFAAGMSGGICWVYDPLDELKAKLSFSPLDVRPAVKEDAPELAELLEAHIRWTESEKASKILKDLENQLPCFKCVVSKEYLALLQKERRN